MKKIILLTLVLCLSNLVNAKDMNYSRKTHQYAVKDTAMFMDVYVPNNVSGLNKTVVYVFGGGFVIGDKRDNDNVEFFESLVDSGFTVVAIDYRLGLRGVKKVGITNPKAPFKAVRMATEDLTSALEFVINKQDMLGVDTSKIVLIGSSAGAITVLQMDYELANRTEIVKNLPQNFRFAGVVSMAGAVFSTKGMPKYQNKPSPTFFLHGTADKVVVYNKLKLFNLAMVGSNCLVKRFVKEDYPFVLYRYDGSQHEVAGFPRHYALKDILWFINDVAYGKHKIQMDVTIRDEYVKQNFVSPVADLSDLYNN